MSTITHPTIFVGENPPRPEGGITNTRIRVSAAYHCLTYDLTFRNFCQFSNKTNLCHVNNDNNALFRLATLLLIQEYSG